MSTFRHPSRLLLNSESAGVYLLAFTLGTTLCVYLAGAIGDIGRQLPPTESNESSAFGFFVGAIVVQLLVAASFLLARLLRKDKRTIAADDWIKRHP